MRRLSKQSGHALMGTMAMLVLVMLLWLAAFGQLSSYVRVQKACQLREERSTGPARALSWGLTLLETGLPPSDPYSCRVSPSEGQTFVVTFTQTFPDGYTVTVHPAGPDDDCLPVAPAQFEHEQEEEAAPQPPVASPFL